MKDHLLQLLTKMASLDWTKINNNIVITYTKKKFYNKFLYKLTYNVPGIRVIHWAKNNTDLNLRVMDWNDRVQKRINAQPQADLIQIREFFKLYQQKSESLKFRIEHNTFNIYSDSEQFLYDLSSTKLKSWTSSLQVVSLVESAKDLQLLDQGFTIVKKKPEYAFRVKIREGFFKDANERQGLALYLKNLGKEIRITKLMLSRLIGSGKYFGGGYVYLNDPRLVDMLKLVAPNLIGPVNQMVTQ